MCIDNGFKMVVVGLFGVMIMECVNLFKVFIVFIDGKQFFDFRVILLEEVVLLLLQLGVKVLVVGIGDYVFRDELRLIVESE